MGLWWIATTELGTWVFNRRQPIFCLLALLCCSSDIDECLDSGVCPEHSECANSLGSYSCHCQDGFISNNSLCEGMGDLLFFVYLLNETSLHLMILWDRDADPHFKTWENWGSERWRHLLKDTQPLKWKNWDLNSCWDLTMNSAVGSGSTWEYGRLSSALSPRGHWPCLETFFMATTGGDGGVVCAIVI